jgi:signal transduction histidine kinase
MSEGSDHSHPLIGLICGHSPALESAIHEVLAESGIGLHHLDHLTDQRPAELSIDFVIGIGSFPDVSPELLTTRRLLAHASTPLYTVLIAEQESPQSSDQIDLILPSAAIHLLPSVLRTLQHTRLLRHELDHARQSLAELRRSTAQLDLLRNAIVQNVTHELRTPMLQVKSAVALLAEEVQPGNPIIDLALTATRRLETGVRNVTLLQELMNESFESKDFSPLPVADLIHSAVRNLGRTWERKPDLDRIVVQLADSLPPILGDRQRLSIALQLLIDNALKFSQSAVHITAEREADCVRFHITDQGIGIPAHLIPRVVEPFFQIDTPTSRKHGGMGIGLTIVQFILDQHNAPLEIYSVEGQGSTFSFSLPAASF